MRSQNGCMLSDWKFTSAVDGSKAKVEKVFKTILDIKGAETSGTPESLAECEGGCPQCARHLACIYRAEIVSVDEK